MFGNRNVFCIIITFCLSTSVLASTEHCDLNLDGTVDYLDLYELTGFWLNDCYEKPVYNIDITQDRFIDFRDFSKLSNDWLLENYNAYQIGHWTFDEGSGYTAYDSTQNGHDAQFRNMNQSNWVSGKRHGALYFDGSNDYLSIHELDNGLGQYFERDFSIALWVNLFSIDERWQAIIGVESTSRFETYGYEGFTIELDYGVPQIYIAFSDDWREIIPATVSLPLNQWQHLCIVREGSSVRIYLDGELNKSQTITSANIKFGSQWPGYDVIGATNDSYYYDTGHFHGMLDDIHLYNFAIPESLVYKLAQQDYAWLPQPEDESTNVSTAATLCWEKGTWPQEYDCHNIYLGTSYSEVLNADTNTAQIYRGRQTSCLFDPCGLDPHTLYYWRVDDVNGTQTHTGEVWSFTTTDFVSSIEASTSQSGFGPYGAYDYDRFDGAVGKCWKGQSGQENWYWQINFTEPQQVGSILMIMGEPGATVDRFRFFQNNTPIEYKWQYSYDGSVWYDLTETEQTDEKRLFRIHRLNMPIAPKHLRLWISDCIGSYPTIREIEIYEDIDTYIPFDEWLVAVDITEYMNPHGNTDWFIELARECSGWSNVQGQQIWLGTFDESFLDIEPYPLCVFLSGSYNEWCQRTQFYFAGLQEALDNENIPIWGSCGGAQVLGLLAETGYDQPWDCPRCRHYHNPAWSPIYGHIGYINPSIEPVDCNLNDYSNNIYESGPYWISKEGTPADPVFAGLSDPFLANESHCGQLNYPPAGWYQVGGIGHPDTKTEFQCIRRTGKYIYAAQFHIENYNSQTWNNSIQIMTNFLNLAQSAGGYQPPDN